MILERTLLFLRKQTKFSQNTQMLIHTIIVQNEFVEVTAAGLRANIFVYLFWAQRLESHRVGQRLAT